MIEPAKTIKALGWMKAPELEMLWTVLQDENAPPQILCVGGCVRNTLLGEAVTDIDLATIHTPDDVIKRLESKGLKVIPTGLDHGTVTAVIDKKSFEITTLRKDIETDGRHAVVSYSKDWAEDAQRRDFTINTLLADLDGNIYDPTGQGLEDLAARHVRFVGDPAQRIAEDYLRVLRYIRFQALYGSGPPDDAILQDCAKAAPQVEKLSKERITQEMFKILMVDQPADYLQLMRDHGLLPGLFNIDAQDLNALNDLATAQVKYNALNLAARLYVLAALDQKQIDKLERYLILPKEILKFIKPLEAAQDTSDLSNDKTLKIALYKEGREAVRQSVLISAFNEIQTDSALEIIQNWDIPTFPVTGDDLIKEGYKPGPELGAELKRREEAWLEENL